MKPKNKLVEEFISKNEKYKLLETTVLSLINKIIEENNFFVMDVQHRVKNIESLEGKIIRKQGKYKNLTDITDLTGFRIICFFTDTVKLLSETLHNYFVIDEKNSIDKSKDLDTTQFGYLSIHFICTLPDTEEYKAISSIPFEIQMRTVLQHAWAEIEHDLGYKSEFGVPKPIRREFSQVASLLELADKEFINLRDNSKKYTLEIKEKIANDQVSDISLDRISFNEYIHNSKHFLNFEKSLKTNFGIDVEVLETSYSYLKHLEWLGVETISDLQQLFDNNNEYAFSQIKNLSDDFGIDIITSTAIIKYLSEGELIRANYSEPQIRKFFSIEEPDTTIIEKNVSRILSIKNNI